MKKPVDIEESLWGRFKTSEQLEEFCRPALEKAAAAQASLSAEALALREAKASEAAAESSQKPKI